MVKINYGCYNTKIKRFSNGQTELRRYDKMIYFDLQEEKNSDVCVGRVSSAQCVSDVENDNDKRIRVDSLSRSRQLLIDYAAENQGLFKSFITLTFKDNIEDLTIANKLFNTWRTAIARAMVRDGQEFYYLGVPEFQKRGAVHYHLLTNLSVDSDYLSLQNGKENMYDVKYWNHGFSSAFDLSVTDDNFNIALYITKYLYKDFDLRLYGRTRVLKSNNLKKPNIERLKVDDTIYQDALMYIENKKYHAAVFSFIPNCDENQYMIPFTSHLVDDIPQDDYNSIRDILEDIQFKKKGEKHEIKGFIKSNDDR